MSYSVLCLPDLYIHTLLHLFTFCFTYVFADSRSACSLKQFMVPTGRPSNSHIYDYKFYEVMHFLQIFRQSFTNLKCPRIPQYYSSSWGIAWFSNSSVFKIHAKIYYVYWFVQEMFLYFHFLILVIIYTGTYLKTVSLDICWDFFLVKNASWWN